MSASAELRELVELARELKTLLQDLQGPEADRARESLTKLNNLVTTYTALARRSGLPSEFLELIRIVQQIRLAIQTLIESIQLLRLTLAGAGLGTGALAAGGLALGTLMIVDLMEIGRQTR